MDTVPETTFSTSFSATIGDVAGQVFDFIICGGGTAGLVLANRLTENPAITVCVLEAGLNLIGDALVDTPANFSQAFSNPRYDWILKTEPQKANRNKIHHMPRGKVLGGSSAINYMMYVRGSAQDYIDWADLTSDPIWAPQSFQSYFRKHETMEPLAASITDRSVFPFQASQHGTSGPIRTSFNDTPPLPIEAAFMKACDATLGYTNRPADPWSGDHIGFFNTLGTVSRDGNDKGKRSYAARGYYEPVKGRKNLTVLCEAAVTRVVLEGSAATGAEFIFAERMHTVQAGKEVIVCGGALKTPQILELSGIGDPDVLKAAGIECKVTNPGIGANLQDHVLSGLVYEVKSGVLTRDALNGPEASKEAARLLNEEQTGPLSLIAGLQGFFPYKRIASPDELAATIDLIRDADTTTDLEEKQREKAIAHLESSDSANLQFLLIPVTMDFERGIEDQSLLFPKFEEESRPHGFAIAANFQYPLSRGTVHVRSSDPMQQPEINPRYGEHPADKAILAAGLRFLDKLVKSGNIGELVGRRTFPLQHVDLSDTRESQEAVEDSIMGTYHPCGSCAMGDALDSRMRVNGVERLRVCDASIFPSNISGNLQATVYALAELGADMIKRDHGLIPIG